MDSPESLQQLEELFHEALRLEPQQRADFLAQARMSNPRLAAAVESLISAHEQSDYFLDTPALEAAAELLEESRPVLATGHVIAQYEIIAPLGRGGMGDVYLANDVKLNRNVALKLLPLRFTESKERLRRFIQEAKAASSLNHPNIITIHEIGEAEGAHFIATEFIEGQTLKQRISQGRMNVGNILDVAIQVASALQSAHEAGIVHRDIKPENIMLRPDGYVKILDFGLAKLTEKPGQSRSADSRVDTMVQARTKPGTVLGTVKYMSPEQARGRILDQRTDVFSLGVVLYEMAAGQIPFSGETSMDTLVSILEKEPPPLEEYAPGTPAEFQRIVSKALRKNREERYQTIKDLLIDLKSLKEELSFQQKLDRLAPKRTSLESAATPPVTESVSAKQTAAAALSLKESKKNGKTAIIWAALIIVIAGVVVGGTWIWRRVSSSSLKPGPTAPVMDRSLRYWITVQKYRDGKPYQEPFQLGDDINF
jgi:serine/threonine protein kinase